MSAYHFIPPAPLSTLHLHLSADDTLWEQLLPHADTLRELRLQAPHIRSVPDSIRQFRQLEVLRLEGCTDLRDLSDALGDLPNLTELILNKTPQLRRLPDTLHRLPLLRRLIVNAVALEALPDTLNQCLALEQLFLDGGERRHPLHVPHLPLPRLRWLRLHALGISELPDDFFADMPALESVVVTNNQLRRLPTSLFQRPHLQRLLLSFNQLETLPDEFIALTQLRDLNLADNRLSALPDNFYFPHLKGLDINKNRLRSLPDSFCQFNQNELHLAFLNNPFTTAPLFFLEWTEQEAKGLEWSDAAKPNLQLLEKQGKDLIAYLSETAIPNERRAAVYRVLTGKSKEGMQAVIDALQRPWTILNERAWERLEQLYAEAFQQQSPTAGKHIALLGQMPMDNDWLQQALETSGFVVTDAIVETTQYAVAGLGASWNAAHEDLVWMSPRQLAALLEQKGQLYLTASTDYEAQLMQLMDSDDEANIAVALEMMRTGGVPKPAFADLLILAISMGGEEIGKQCEQLILLYGHPALRPLLRFAYEEYKPGAGVHPLLIDRKRWAEYWKAVQAGALDLDRLLYYLDKLQVAYTRPYWAMLEGETLHAAVRRYLAANEGSVTGHTFPRWEMMSDYPEIRRLDLSFCNYKKVPEGLVKLVPNLRELNLSNNNLVDLPDEIEQLSQVETIDISNNFLTDFPLVLERLPRLEWILCGGNPFAKTLKQQYSKRQPIAHPDPARFDLSRLALEIRRR